jgi:glycosyltransferase involved in cell wall biosynthesis
MRILTLTTLYPNASTPTRAIFVENRLRRIVEMGGVSARVVSPLPWFPSRDPRFGAYAAFAAAPREEVRHGIRITHPRYLVMPKVCTSLQAWTYLIAARREAEQVIEEGFPFDLIDAHYVYPDGVAAAWLGRQMGKPVVVTARGTDLNVIASLPGPGRQIRRAFDRIARLIAVSDALAERARSLGMPGDRIVVLRNGVDTSLFRPVDGSRWRMLAPGATPLLLSVGNLVHLKGHDLVIRALVELENAHLLIAGGGPEQRKLEALGKRLSVAERVHFLGVVPHEELAAVYSAADLLVLASEREGWPNVLLEAMACGTPAVAARVGGTPEIVTAPEAGVLIEERSARGIVAAVKRLLSELPARSEVRAHAQRYGWDDTIAKQVALYHEVVEQARAHAGH